MMTFIKYTLPFALILLLFTNLFAKDPITWKPITSADLAMDKPLVEADADAEAIFWEVRLDDDNSNKLFYEHYIRVKIFTERGRERFSKIDIPFFKGKKVDEVAARVIKPDGSIIELKPEDIFEREIFKRKKLKIKSKSFAVPAIAPGVIVEYQYREIFKNDSADGEQLPFQKDIPLQRISYYLRPFKGQSLRLKPRNMKLGVIRKLDDGFYEATDTNVPAYKEEPRMPPEEEIRRWCSLQYRYRFSYRGYSLNITWGGLVSGTGNIFSKMTEPDEQIEQKAKELTASSTSDIDKLRKLYNFSQKHIKNITYDESAISGKRPKIKKASDVLKYGVGSAKNIDYLFASLAIAAGFDDVNAALFTNRSSNFFNPTNYPVHPAYVRSGGIAVAVDGKWRFFSPGIPYLPFEKLLWNEELVYTLLAKKGFSTWTHTPLSSHEVSKGSRQGKFKLNENGDLEGNVSLEYTGNLAISRRQAGFIETDFKEDLQEWVSTGEFSDVKVVNFETNDKPVGFSYKLRIPNYATTTDKRMFFQPSVFQYNSEPEFISSTRIHPIYFNYPWSELDEVEIKLPDEFALEDFDQPDNVINQKNVSEAKYTIKYDQETNTLLYKRNFYFGRDNQILFPTKYYKPLKEMFDLLHKSDLHKLSLKRK